MSGASEDVERLDRWSSALWQWAMDRPDFAVVSAASFMKEDINTIQRIEGYLSLAVANAILQELGSALKYVEDARQLLRSDASEVPMDQASVLSKLLATVETTVGKTL
jgi:hypothetical protein